MLHIVYCANIITNIGKQIYIFEGNSCIKLLYVKVSVGMLQGMISITIAKRDLYTISYKQVYVILISADYA